MNLTDIEIGQWVVYRPDHGLPEDGIVTGVRGELAMVRYYGDADAKATRPADLEAGTGA